MLRRLVQVDPGDRLKVLALFLYMFLAVGGTVVVGRSVGRALFLSALPPEAVPLKLAVSALAVVGATVAYSALGARLPLGRLVVASQLVLGGGLVGLWLLLKTPLGGTLPLLTGLFGWVEIVAALVTTQFWVLAGQLFDPRSARRSFGLIAAGGPLANIAAGALLAGVAERVATADLLLVIAGAVGLCALATRQLTQAHPEALGDERPRGAGAPVGARSGERADERPSLGTTLVATARSPLLGAIAGIILLGTAVTNIVDYQLDLALQRSYGGDGAAMTAFLGSYNLWVGAAAFAIQLGLVALVLERFGLRASLATLPAGFALGSAAVLASGGALIAVAAARANDLLFRFTLNDAGLNMLYLPVPAAARRRAKEALDGVVKPLAAVLLAGTFAAARAAGLSDLVVWSAPALLLAGLWLWLVARAGGAYRVALLESLRRRRLDFEGLRIDAADPATRAALLGALHGPDEALALAALKTIAEAPGRDWDDAVARLLDSPSAELRIAAAAHLGGSGRAALRPAVARLLDAAEPAVRAAGVVALAELGDLSRLEAALADPVLAVRRAAVVGLMRAGASARVEEALRAMLASPDAPERAAGAAAIGEIGRSGRDAELARAIDDPSIEVQRAALRAAGAVGGVSLVERVVDKLAVGALAGVAAEALAAMAAPSTEGLGADRGGSAAPAPRDAARRLDADRVLALLRERLADPEAEPAVRRAIPALLARIGGERVEPTLLERIGDGDAEVRGAVYATLGSMGVSDPAARELLGQRVGEELREAYALRALWADLGAEGRGELLDEALEARVERAVDRVFALLGILHPSAGLGEAWRGVRSGDARKRANAIELVDDSLARAWRADLLRLLEAPPEQVAELAAERFEVARRGRGERLAELAGGEDRWLRACALQRIGRLGLAELAEAIEAGMRAPDPLVRETALAAGQSLLPPERVVALLAEGPAR